MVHLDLLSLLRLEDSVQEDIDCTLLVPALLRLTVQYGHPHHHTQALLAGLGKLFKHGLLAIQLGNAVEVGWARGSVSLVWCLPWRAGEDVVGRDVDEKDTTSSTSLGECAGGLDVEETRAFGISINLVGEAVGGAVDEDVRAMKVLVLVAETGNC